MLPSALLLPLQTLILLLCIFYMKTNKQTNFIPFLKISVPQLDFTCPSVHNYMAISNIYIYEALAHQKAQHRSHQRHSVEWK